MAIEKTRKTLNVKVMNPNEIVWEGEAYSVSSKNGFGSFDILPEHANFITLIGHEPIVVTTKHDKKSFIFDSSVLRVHADSVLIFAQIEI